MNRGANRRLAGLVVAGVVLVLLNLVGALQPLKNLAGWVFSPIQSSFSKAGAATGNFFEMVGSVGSLAAENQKLKRQNAVLRQRLSEDVELRAQYANLRKQLDFTVVEPSRLVGAEVVSYQPDNFRQFITINRGKRAGIAVGMGVIAEGSLVGTVQEVSDGNAKVFLLIDPNFRVGGLNQDQASRPTGTVRGRIGGGLIMEKIAQNETVRIGDTIVTSGLGGVLPRGIMIGRVETVDAKDNSVFQSAQLHSGLKFNRLEMVYVVVK